MKVSYGRGILAVLVVAAGAVAILFWWNRGDAVEPRSATRGTAPARTYIPDKVALRAPSSAKASTDEPANPSPDEPPVSDDFDDNPLANVLRPLLANDVQLDTFMYYHNRPLLDAATNVHYHEFLSDPAMFANVKQDLLYPEETKVSQGASIKRLMKIDYLREALEWKENPQRAELIALVEEMLLTDNYPAGMGMDMRISLSGNKMELYELLFDIAPDRAVAVLEKSKGTRLEAMLAWIANSLETRRQIEAKLDTEVRPPSSPPP
jgi:hypothetical protein